MKSNKTPLCLFVFFAIVSLFCNPAKAENANRFVHELDDYIETVRTTWNIPAIAVAVVQDDKIILLKGYGVTDFKTNKKTNIHTVFQIASLSKTFTSTLVEILAEENKLSLDAPITKYLPKLSLGSPEQTKQITLRHILSHTTGFPHHAGDPKIEGGEDFESIIKSFSDLKVLYPPGKIHGYQNAIYSLAGTVVRKVTNTSYANALSSYILDPLGMSDTTTGFEALNNASNKAIPHRYSPKLTYPVSFSKNYYTVTPAAGINTSIADLGQWLLFQMGALTPKWNNTAPLLSQKGLDEIHKPYVSTPAETAHMRTYRDRILKTSYGLGWRNYDWAGNNIVCHGGMLNGFKSLMSFSPKKRSGIVTITNSTGPAVGIIRSYFFDKVFDQPFVDYNQKFKDQETSAVQKKAVRKATRKGKQKSKKRK